MPEILENKIYDVAIIGGGIAGAAIADEASARGLRVVLFEKNTFGSGTSSKSSKLIHGGIRYLETAWQAFKRFDFLEGFKNFRFVFVSLQQSRLLQKTWPNLVKPIALFIPILKKGNRSRWTVYAGCWIYFVLASFSGKALPPKFFWTKKSALEVMPDLDENNLIGGVLIWDHWTDDQKLVEATIARAAFNGAETFEHAEVLNYFYDNPNKHYEIKIKMPGEELKFLSKKLVNASGPWVDLVRAQNGPAKEHFLSTVAGAHLTLKKFLPHSVILEALDHRIFFVINIGDKARVGTTERFHENPDNVEPTEDEITYLLKNLRRYFPKMTFDPKDILSKDAGVRPLVKPKFEKSHHEISREHEIRQDALGVFHVLGVKLTDHRRAAKEAVDLILNR